MRPAAVPGDADVLGLAFRRMRRARPLSLMLVALYALASVLLQPLAGPVYGAGSRWTGGAGLLGAVLVETGIVYRLVADMVGKRATAAGLPWFYAGGLLGLLPLVVMVAVALSLSHATDGTAVTLLFFGLFAGYACVMLLQGWPVAMAARRGWVSPLRMLRATRGHRRHLLFAMIVIGVLNSLPEAEPMEPAARQLAFGAMQVAAMMLQTLLLGGLASAACDAARANDPGLREGGISD